MPEEKTFLKITEVSARFNDACVQLVQDMAAVQGDSFQIQASIQLWQAKAMFAMAQQLAMVAKHLADITAECERAASIDKAKTSSKKV